MMFKGDWGCCPNKRMSKSSKQGPVCTACEFVNLYRFTLLANLWRHNISVMLIRKPEIGACFTFYSRRVGGNFTFRQLVGKLKCNLQSGKQCSISKKACQRSIPENLWTVSTMLTNRQNRTYWENAWTSQKESSGVSLFIILIFQIRNLAHIRQPYSRSIYKATRIFCLRRNGGRNGSVQLSTNTFRP